MKLPIPFNNPATYEGHSGVDYEHSGVDYGQPRGTLFRASGSGHVLWLGSNDRGGNFIWVWYDAIMIAVGYHHMDSHNSCPPEGSSFGYGDVLGAVGNTGNSTGPHLHSEVEGHATTDGYWKFFDPNRVVGDKDEIPQPAPSKKTKDEDMDFINISGKAGSHRAGQFAIYRKNSDGTLVAKRLTFDTMNPALPTFDNEALVQMQRAMPFIDLV